MKERTSSKSIKILIIALFVCFASIASDGFNAIAAGAPSAFSYKNFKFMGCGKKGLADAIFLVENTNDKHIKAYTTGFHGELQFCNSKKKVLKTVRFEPYSTSLEGTTLYANFAYVTVKYHLRKNSVYYYRVRRFNVTSKGARIYSPWTKYKAFATIKPKMKEKLKKKRSVTFKCPKKLPKPVKCIKIMIDKKQVASLKRGQSKKIKKLRGKAFRKGDAYSVSIIPVLKDGIPCMNAYEGRVVF